MSKRVGESRHPLLYSNCCSEPVSCAAVEEDCTSGLVIEVFGDSGKVGHKAACLTLSKAFFFFFFQVLDNIVEILLVLDIFVTADL